MFPVDIEGAIPLNPLDAQQTAQVLNAVVTSLGVAQVMELSRQDCEVGFRRDWSMMFGFAGYGPLGPVGGGLIRVVGGPAAKVEYRFSIARFVTVASLLIASMGVAMATTEHAVISAVGFVVLGGAWIIGGTYAIAAFRLRRFVKLAVGPACRTVTGVGPCACPVCGALYNPEDYRPDAEMLCEACHSPLGTASA